MPQLSMEKHTHTFTVAAYSPLDSALSAVTCCVLYKHMLSKSHSSATRRHCVRSCMRKWESGICIFTYNGIFRIQLRYYCCFCCLCCFCCCLFCCCCCWPRGDITHCATSRVSDLAAAATAAVDAQPKRCSGSRHRLFAAFQQDVGKRTRETKEWTTTTIVVALSGVLECKQKPDNFICIYKL